MVLVLCGYNSFAVTVFRLRLSKGLTMLVSMEKKKKVSGKHVTPRRTYALPEDWAKVLRQVAAKEGRPAVWILVRLLSEHAKTLGVEIPAFPWDDEE